MSDDLNALFHPPRDPDRPRDAALTAAVMSRVRALPTPADRRRTRYALIALCAIGYAVALAPIDLIGEAVGAIGAPSLDADAGLEAAVAVAIVVVCAAFAVRRRHAR